MKTIRNLLIGAGAAAALALASAVLADDKKSEDKAGEHVGCDHGQGQHGHGRGHGHGGGQK